MPPIQEISKTHKTNCPSAPNAKNIKTNCPDASNSKNIKNSQNKTTYTQLFKNNFLCQTVSISNNYKPTSWFPSIKYGSVSFLFIF